MRKPTGQMQEETQKYLDDYNLLYNWDYNEMCDFIEVYGETMFLSHYETYHRLVEDYGMELVDNFANYFDTRKEITDLFCKKVEGMDDGEIMTALKQAHRVAEEQQRGRGRDGARGEAAGLDDLSGDPHLAQAGGRETVARGDDGATPDGLTGKTGRQPVNASDAATLMAGTCKIKRTKIT